MHKATPGGVALRCVAAGLRLRLRIPGGSLRPKGFADGAPGIENQQAHSQITSPSATTDSPR